MLLPVLQPLCSLVAEGSLRGPWVGMGREERGSISAPERGGSRILKAHLVQPHLFRQIILRKWDLPWATCWLTDRVQNFCSLDFFAPTTSQESAVSSSLASLGPRLHSLPFLPFSRHFEMSELINENEIISVGNQAAPFCSAF